MDLREQLIHDHEEGESIAALSEIYGVARPRRMLYRAVTVRERSAGGRKNCASNPCSRIEVLRMFPGGPFPYVTTSGSSRPKRSFNLRNCRTLRASGSTIAIRSASHLVLKRST
jgi:hypothetical protein